jgi:transposase
VYGLKHQKEKRSMNHFAGLDVSVKETGVCIVDDTGKIVREVKVASEPEALLHVLGSPAYRFKRIGLEAGPLSQWLFGALAEAGLPAICVETRHMRAVLKAQINKTDRNDARGMAQMMRAGLYRPMHVKTLRSQKLRMLLTHRKLLQSKAIAIDNDLRGTLRNFGLKVGIVGTVKFEARIRELIEDLPDLAVLVEPLLVVRRVLREQLGILHRRLLAIVRDDEVCLRLMTIPGVGPVVALTYRATVDVPARFKNSKAVGAVMGLTPSKYQSGESERTGGISRCGDEMIRVMLYEAAQILLVRSTKWSWLKAWAMQIARRRGIKKAIVALARRLAVAWPWSCTASGLTAPSSGGPGKSQRHESLMGSNPIGGNASSTVRWHDVPRGTTDEARSYVRLDLSFI